MFRLLQGDLRVLERAKEKRESTEKRPERKGEDERRWGVEAKQNNCAATSD